MRRRDIREARKQAAAQDWRAALEPVPANDEAQPENDDGTWAGFNDDTPNAEDISYIDARRLYG